MCQTCPCTLKRLEWLEKEVTILREEREQKKNRKNKKKNGLEQLDEEQQKEVKDLVVWKPRVLSQLY